MIYENPSSTKQDDVVSVSNDSQLVIQHQTPFVCADLALVYATLTFLRQEWFQSLPIVTQYWFGATLLLTVAGNLGIVSPMNYLLIWENVKDKFEIWRLLTCFCYAGKFEFPTLIALYLLMNFSQNYEKGGPFNTGAGGGSADYLFMLLFGGHNHDCDATSA